MMFVGMAEDAIVFIEAEAAFDAKQFASVELGATDDRPVVCDRVEGQITPDVVLEWRGSDAGANGGRRLFVKRRETSAAKSRETSAAKSLDGDRAWWDRLLRKESRPRDTEIVGVADAGPTPALVPAQIQQPDTVTYVVDEIRAISPGAMVSLVGTAEFDALSANLRATQERCNTLLDETRFARRERDAWHLALARCIGLDRFPLRLSFVFDAITRERARQDAKWGPIGATNGPQNALAIPFGTGRPGSREAADNARASCDALFKTGHGTWADVLEEELAGALAESDPVKLREELVQLAAVCVKCVEILEWKAAPHG